MPAIYSNVINWWYHYYSRGNNMIIRNLSPEHFLLASEAPYFKHTPDFANYKYDSKICHWQIGRGITEKKSIIVVKTTVGVNQPPKGCIWKAPFIVGYFRVAYNNDGLIIMDKEDSLLLLSDPIRVDQAWLMRLFPAKPPCCWSSPSNIVRTMTLRNCHIRCDQLKIILQELYKRKENGSKNYLGTPYNELLSRMPKQAKLYNYN